MEKITVLFLCTGNSCRSHMAEGWAECLKSDSIAAFSAGVSPGKVNEQAIAIMAEAGVGLSDHYSKHLDEFSGFEFDYVVTLCDNASEHCPVYSGKTKVIHRPFDDPSFVIGCVEKVTAEFRRVRDEIREFVNGMPENLER